MARYVLTSNITIPAGTVFVTSDALDEGGIEMDLGDAPVVEGCMRIFMGRRAALEAGLVTVAARTSAPHLKVVA